MKELIALSVACVAVGLMLISLVISIKGPVQPKRFEYLITYQTKDMAGDMVVSRTDIGTWNVGRTRELIRQRNGFPTNEAVIIHNIFKLGESDDD